MSDAERMVPVLLALADHGVDPDIQEMLLRGNGKVRPGALRAALDAWSAALAQARIDAAVEAVDALMWHIGDTPKLRQDDELWALWTGVRAKFDAAGLGRFAAIRARKGE